MAGSVDYSIKPQFDPSYRPQTLLHPLLHKQTQSPQTSLCGFVTETERGRRERVLKSSKVQLKPYCCYTCYTSSDKQAATRESREARGERISPERGRKEESETEGKIQSGERKKECNLAREGPVASNCSSQDITVYLGGVKWLQAVFLFHYRASNQTSPFLLPQLTESV